MFETLQSVMMRDPKAVERAVQVLSVSRHLERIADSATNIAEDIVFMVEGDIIRHRADPARNPPRVKR
jgi:phosphate transport system protein